MELVAFLKAIVVLAFIAFGGLKILQWGMIGVALIIALILLARRRRSPILIAMASLLLLGAAGIALIPLPGSDDLFGPADKFARPRQLVEARETCDAELPALPDRYTASSLVDEASGVSETTLILLLVQRRLDFVELRLAGKADAERHGHFANHLPRTAQAADAAYLRLALAAQGDPDCLAQPAMPEDLRDYLSVWPLPSGACLQARYSDRSSAAVSIAYVLQPQPKRPVWGHYQLSDKASGRVIAQLTSADGYQAPSADNISTFNPAFSRPDCRTPHTALVDRLVGSNGPGPAPQAVNPGASR